MTSKVGTHESQKDVYFEQQGVLGGDNIGELLFCEHYVYGKMHRAKFTNSPHYTKEIIDSVYSDLWELARITSHGGISYLITFLDNSS